MLAMERTVVLAAAATGSALTIASMVCVDGPVLLEGANSIDASALAALTATLTLKQGGAIAFPALNQVGNVRLAVTTKITSVDFTSVTTGGVITTSDDTLSDPAISGDVNLGKLDLPPNVSLNAATSISAGGAPVLLIFNGLSV